VKNEIALPAAVKKLWKAREELHKNFGGKFSFTLDGKLVGDIGEAVACAAFNLRAPDKRTTGVDAIAPNNLTVQIKATGKDNSGPAFSPGEATADHLLFLQIDFPAAVARVLYNGPEKQIRKHVPNIERGTKSVRRSTVIEENEKVPSSKRLKLRSR